MDNHDSFNSPDARGLHHPHGRSYHLHGEPWTNVRVTITEEEGMLPSPSLSISIAPSPAISPIRSRSPSFSQYNHHHNHTTGLYSHHRTASPQLRSVLKSRHLSPIKQEDEEGQRQQGQFVANHAADQGNVDVVVDKRDEVESKTDSDIPWFAHPNHRDGVLADGDPLPSLNSLAVKQMNDERDHHMGKPIESKKVEQMQPHVNINIHVNVGSGIHGNHTHLPVNTGNCHPESAGATHIAHNDVEEPNNTTSITADGHTTGGSILSHEDNNNNNNSIRQSTENHIYTGGQRPHRYSGSRTYAEEIPALSDFRYNDEPALTIHHLPIFSPTISPTNNPLQ
jgi:hypothetical protein